MSQVLTVDCVGDGIRRLRFSDDSNPQMTAPQRPNTIDVSQYRDWLLDHTEMLCRVDTTTGREDSGLPQLNELLTQLGASIHLQEVAPRRHNVLATWGEPRLLFSTHLDTVPPYLPPQRSDDVLSGRGTCDAKGQIAVQLAAIKELLSLGHTNLAWLGVIGEETDSIGAAAAQGLGTRLRECAGLINGEPAPLQTGRANAEQPAEFGTEADTRGVLAEQS